MAAGVTLDGGSGAAYARIMGVGAYRPRRVVPNSELVEAIDSSDEWIQQRSGIKTRRWAAARTGRAGTRLRFPRGQSRPGQ